MRLPDAEMGFMYIAELTSPEDNKVENLVVHDRDGIFYVEFDSAVHSFDVMNRNTRMYSGPNIDKCLQTERIQHYLSHGGWYGEVNHPISKYKDRPLSAERVRDIDMNNTSHRMLNPHREGNLLVSRIQTDAGTPGGMNLARKMVQGFIPGFSCRAIAAMNLQNGKPMVDVRFLVTYDWVLFQSHREAEHLGGKNTFVHKNAPTMTLENASHEDVIVPITDLISVVAGRDSNAQIIMESFNLDMDSITGFSNDKKHLIMRDQDNVIYCNIDPRNRATVNEFLRSF